MMLSLVEEEEEEVEGEEDTSSSCPKCQGMELERREVRKEFETEIARMKKEVESANKTKENIVMKYATSEVEVLKWKKNVENSDKVIKQLNSDVDIANKKNKMLSSERERLTLMIDAKFHEIEDLHKEITRLKEDIASRDFKVTWAQNKLKEETEAHNNTKRKLEEIEKSQLVVHFTNGDVCEEDKSNGETKEVSDPSQVPSDGDGELSVVSEFDELKQRVIQLTAGKERLEEKVEFMERAKLELEDKIVKLESSNSEHLHQIAALQSDLAATEFLKVQLQKETELIKSLEQQCEGLRQAHSDVLHDMSLSRTKEAELLAYTQQVTEKNVALQATLSSIEAKSAVLKDENERLRRSVDQCETQVRSLQQGIQATNQTETDERQSLKDEISVNKKVVSDLQRQLDEARGEISVLNRKLTSSVRELSKELHVARKQVKDGHSGSDGLSQSSRTSSSSSLANGECLVSQEKQSIKQEESSSAVETSDQECPPAMPDHQVLIERIVKLQRTLAKKQDKLEFLQEHVKQLVESLQKKSKIIQAYAMSQDIESLSSNLAEQNRAEILKHKSIMASVYGSKPMDDTMTLELSLEINRKLQVVLEDILLRNITLKDSLNTLGKEISKLTEANQDLANQANKLSK